MSKTWPLLHSHIKPEGLMGNNLVYAKPYGLSGHCTGAQLL